MPETDIQTTEQRGAHVLFSDKVVQLLESEKVAALPHSSHRNSMMRERA